MQSLERISQQIYRVRGRRVMLSVDLAAVYGVVPKVLIQAVKRNKERFPVDFMFQLSQEEFANLKSQIVTSSWGGIRRARPYAFTEQGVAMLSSVLHSPRAIQANITIMRAFVQLREVASNNRRLLRKLAELEKRVNRHDVEINDLIDAIRNEALADETRKRRIGFLSSEEV